MWLQVGTFSLLPTRPLPLPSLFFPLGSSGLKGSSSRCGTDSKRFAHCRYISSKTQEAASLFFSSGASFVRFPFLALSPHPQSPSLSLTFLPDDAHSLGKHIFWRAVLKTADPDTPSLYHIPPSSTPPDQVVLICSEPLTFERSDWTEVHTNSLLVVTSRLNVLQIPIRDGYATDGSLGEEGRGRALVRGWGLATGYAPEEQDEERRTVEVEGRTVEVTV